MTAPTVVWEGPIDGETYRLVSRGPTCSHVENRRVDAMENHAWVPEGDEDTRTEVVNRALHKLALLMGAGCTSSPSSWGPAK